MPFQSKAQARLFFAKNPQKAKAMVKETPGGIKSLPEKKHPSVNPKGKKLKNVKLTKTSGAGRFFRDMPGRDDGLFLEKDAFNAYPPGQIPQGGGINVGSSGAAMGGMGGGGAGMGTSYGTGTGKPPKRPRPVAKVAASKPSDEWDLDRSDFPVGLHRPTEEQPEALEAGLERFHMTDADHPPSFGTGTGLGKGVGSDHRMKVAPTTGHQLGKHASVTPRRFLGTSATIDKQAAPEGYWGQRASEFGGSLQEGGRRAASYADEGVQAITKSPIAAGLAALALGRVGLRGLKGGGRLVGRGVKRIRQGPPPPPSPVASGVGNAAQRLRKFITG